MKITLSVLMELNSRKKQFYKYSLSILWFLWLRYQKMFPLKIIFKGDFLKEPYFLEICSLGMVPKSDAIQFSTTCSAVIAPGITV